MPRRPIVAKKLTAAEIAREATISAADVEHAALAWKRDTRADARRLLDATDHRAAPQKRRPAPDA